MRVYVLTLNLYVGNYVIGVFATKGKAESTIDLIMNATTNRLRDNIKIDYTKDIYREDFTITEVHMSCINRNIL